MSEWRRILDWEGCYNVRELGGYPTEKGQETRWGRVVRSDNLIQLTAAGREALESYGVRTIIDLRLPEELEMHPPPYLEHPSVDYRHLSLVDPAAAGSGPVYATLADDYKGMLERFAPRIAQIMSAIATAPEGVVLVHCHGGRDRTGVISALLLRLAGVPVEIASEDYSLSSERLRPLDQEWLDNGPNDRAWREAELAKWMTRAEVMREVLEHLESQHGSVEGYLLDAGVTADEIGRLKDRLLS